MAKQSKKQAAKRSGPHLAAAVFCDNVLQEKQDGALTVIRIIDTVNVTLHPSTPADVPSEANRIPVTVQGLVSFRTGDAPGEHTIRLQMQSPSGKTTDIYQTSLVFKPEPNAGGNVLFNSVIAVMKGGLFWLSVYLDDQKMTQMPLMINVNRGEAAPSIEAPPKEVPTAKKTKSK